MVVELNSSLEREQLYTALRIHNPIVANGRIPIAYERDDLSIDITNSFLDSLDTNHQNTSH